MQDPHWFESWFSSPYYRILYQHRDELEAEAFVEHLIDYLQPLPHSRMLDIACGEGRFSTELADRGFDVTGIDLSHSSIEKAKAHESAHLHFYVHDMRMPFYINYFDYAFNFFTSFGYFANTRDHQLAAKSFSNGLKKNGYLVLDYLNSDKSARELVPEEDIYRGNYVFHIRRQLEGGHFLKEITFLDAEGREKKYVERVAAFGLAQFLEMFRKSGLSLVATFGNYKLQEYNPLQSPRLIMIFKK
jgi:SAM-dependent methyltransferase